MYVFEGSWYLDMFMVLRGRGSSDMSCNACHVRRCLECNAEDLVEDFEVERLPYPSKTYFLVGSL